MPRRRPPQTQEAAISRAARAFLRGTSHPTPDSAIRAGARTEEQWQATLDGARARFWSSNGLRARKKVQARRPMSRTAEVHLASK